MASFELKILTEDPAELKTLVDKLCRVHVEVHNLTGGKIVAERKLIPGEVLQAVDITSATAGEPYVMGVSNVVSAPVDLSDIDAETTVAPAPAVTPATTSDRDAEGIKRDARIHSDAAEPFKADGTWKRKRNTPDDVYESVYEELAREAHAAGLYKGPLLGQFELESKVVDEGGPYYWSHDESDCVGICQTLKELSDMQDSDPCVENIGKEQYDARVAAGAAGDHKDKAPAPVAPAVEAAPAPTPVAPAPQAAPAPAAPAPAPQAAPAGLSAQVSASEQRCKTAMAGMVVKCGSTVAVKALNMFGGAHAITVLTPEQREQFCNVAEALIASGATAADGSDKLAEIAVLMGVAV